MVSREAYSVGGGLVTGENVTTPRASPPTEGQEVCSVGGEPPPPTPPLFRTGEMEDSKKSKDDRSRIGMVNKSESTKTGENSLLNKKKLVEDPSQQGQVLSEVGHQPPSEVGHMTSHPQTLSPDRSLLLEGGEPQDRSRDNITNRPPRHDGTVDNITIGNKQPTSITVNGVPLRDVLMRKKQSKTDRTTPSKRKLEAEKKKNKTTTPSVANTKKIWEYMIEKRARMEDNGTVEDNPVEDDQRQQNGIEDKEDNVRKKSSPETTVHLEVVDSKPTPDVKTTFGTTVVRKRNNLSDRILKFQDLVNGDECVVRSGYCVTHNLKTIRKIVNVRTSKLDKNDRVEWRLSDSTIMSCPMAQPRKPTSTISADQNQLPEWGKTNGKTFKNADEETAPIT